MIRRNTELQSDTQTPRQRTSTVGISKWPGGGARGGERGESLPKRPKCGSGIHRLGTCGPSNSRHKLDCFYDSRPQNQRFCLTDLSWVLDLKKGDNQNKVLVSIYFLVCKGLSIGEVRLSWDTAFEKIRL